MKSLVVVFSELHTNTPDIEMLVRLVDMGQKQL